jgi:lactoylglutathione lyase
MVPNITATQERFESFNIPILKEGEMPNDYGMLPGASGLLDARILPGALQGVIMIGFDRFLVVADPDGNLVEPQEQD